MGELHPLLGHREQTGRLARRQGGYVDAEAAAGAGDLGQILAGRGRDQSRRHGLGVSSAPRRA